MERSLLEIPFFGLDQKTDAKLVQPGKMLLAEDARWVKAKEVAKRTGMKALPAKVLAPFVPAVPVPATGLALWLDATKDVYADAAFTTAAVNGGDVAGWKDQSGNARHATSGSAGDNAPSLLTGAINGKQAIHFDPSGTPKSFHFPTASPFSFTDMSVFAVMKFSSNADGQTLLCNFDLGTHLGWWLLVSNPGVAQHVFLTEPGDDALRAGGVVAGTATLLGYLLDSVGTAKTIRQDRAQVGHEAPGTMPVYGGSPPQQAKIGTTDSINYPLRGDLGELLVYNRLLDAADIAIVETYLAAKWGTP